MSVQAEKVVAVMDDASQRERAAKPRPYSIVHDLTREIEAAKELRAQILSLAEGDEDFARDVIEGETDLREILARLVESEAEDDAIVAGITTLVDRLSDRKDRIKHRIEMRRALMVQGLSAAGLRKLETPGGTISLRPVPPSAIITEEADIPARFWRQPAPTLDKRALLAALKEGAVIGATLSNGSETVSVRR